MENIRRNVMHNVKVNRVELLNIVYKNKEKHVADYAESVEDYKKAAIKLAAEHVELAATGNLDKIAKIKAMPQRPTSYEKEYDRAIRMLELSVEDVIDVAQDVFNQLVLDEWTWKNAFVASASLYKTM
jgi:ribosomal protein L23